MNNKPNDMMKFPLPYFLKYCILSFLVGMSLTLSAQHRTDGGQPVQLPPHTIEGWLPNGLHYLILPNNSPTHTTEFRLVMRVGSVQEDEQQKGSAHFLEHMAFNGSTHFPGRSMVDYFESLGMKYGRDINAFTGFDRTIFLYTVPMGRDDGHVADTTLLVMRDCLNGLAFDAERTKRERGVILEELRGYDYGDDFYGLKIGNNRFSQRLPLGNSEDIRSIDREKLVDYYRRWYSPELATVVVVGDVDASEMERKIHACFASLPAKAVKDFQVYPLTYKPGIALHELRDTLRRHSQLELMIPHPCVVARTVDSHYRKELGNLLVRALIRRFQLQQTDCQVSDNWYLSDKNHFVLALQGRDKASLLEQVTDVAAQLKSIRENGFCPGEMDAVAREYTDHLKAQYSDQLSSKWCDDFVDYVISGDRYINTADEMEAVKEKLRATKSEDLQQLLDEWLGWKDSCMLVAYRNYAGPENSLTEAEVEQAWDAGEQRPAAVFAYEAPEEEEVERISTPACLAERPPYLAEMIATEHTYPDTKVTELTLKNGLHIVLRPTIDNGNNLLLTAFARGGTDDLTPEEYLRYDGAGGYLEMGGIARVDRDTLTSYLLQEELSMNTMIGNDWHEVMGMAPPAKFAELCNLIYEKMHRPELCHDDFAEVRRDELESFGKETLLSQMMKRASDRMVVNRLDSLMGNASANSCLTRTKADLEAQTLDEMADYYVRLFSNPEGLTFVVTGAFQVDSVKQALVATFGRMQRPERPMRPAGRTFSLPAKTYVEGFANDNESQTIFDYVYFGNYRPSLTESLTLKLVRDVLQNRLLSVLREQESVVYSPYVSLFYHGQPQGTYYFDLSASVDYANTSRIDTLLRQIIDDLRSRPVPADELENLKTSFLVTKRQVLSDMASVDWRNNLVNLLKNGETLADFENYERCLRAISPDDLLQAIRRYLNPDKFVLLYIGKHQNYE